MTKVLLTITRDVNMSNGGIEIDGEKDFDVTVDVSEGVPDHYGYTEQGRGEEFKLTDDERERVRDMWERIE